MLPSPLTFQTPVVQSGPSFARDEAGQSGPSYTRDGSAERERKRKTSDDGSDSGQKRIKA
jgi:MADS-box transcription factor